MMGERFEAVPPEALGWFRSVLGEEDWERVEARRAEHQRHVRGPTERLCEELEDRFGPAKVWHLHKTPWLWHHQVATVSVADTIAYRIVLSLDEVEISGGWLRSGPDQVERYRQAVAGPAGQGLAEAVEGLLNSGFELEGHRLVRGPRGLPEDHPRRDLLRHRSLIGQRFLPVEDWVGTRALLDEVAEGWEALRPLVTWLATHVGARQRKGSTS